MSVLIEGMEMPKEGFVEILIRDDSTVQQTGQSYRIDGTDYYTPYIDEMPVMYKAVPVPEPHGRLIDADEFLKRAIGTKCFRGDFALMLEELVGESTTIIPASESKERPAFLPTYELTPRREEG